MQVFTCGPVITARVPDFLREKLMREYVPPLQADMADAEAFISAAVSPETLGAVADLSIAHTPVKTFFESLLRENENLRIAVIVKKGERTASDIEKLNRNPRLLFLKDGRRDLARTIAVFLGYQENAPTDAESAPSVGSDPPVQVQATLAEVAEQHIVDAAPLPPSVPLAASKPRPRPTEPTRAKRDPTATIKEAALDKLRGEPPLPDLQERFPRKEKQQVPEPASAPPPEPPIPVERPPAPTPPVHPIHRQASAKVICVYSGTHGTGCTWMSLQLARYLARQPGIQVALCGEPELLRVGQRYVRPGDQVFDLDGVTVYGQTPLDGIDAAVYDYIVCDAGVAVAADADDVLVGMPPSKKRDMLLHWQQRQPDCPAGEYYGKLQRRLAPGNTGRLPGADPPGAGAEIMAIITVPRAIHKYGRVDMRIKYIANPSKTTAKAVSDNIRYVANPEKTDGQRLLYTQNCVSVETAFEEMNEVREEYQSLGSVLAYSFIQSFGDFETTPEIAHEIGQKLAQRFFLNQYQVVMGTHVDHDHLHNHFIFNAVSCEDGKKYLNKKRYLSELRNLSDGLCAEYGLSVIENPSRASRVPYPDWKAKQGGEPTRDDVIRQDMDAAVLYALSFSHFVKILRDNGYSVRYGPNIRYYSVSAPGMQRNRRGYQLGDAYGEAAIRRRIQERLQDGRLPPLPRERPQAAHALKGSFIRRQPRKLHGFQAGYYRFLYEIYAIRKRPQRNREFFFRNYAVISRIRDMAKDGQYLRQHGYATVDQLQIRSLALTRQIDQLVKARDSLSWKKQRAATVPEKEGLTQDVYALNEQLLLLRQERKQVERILRSSVAQTELQREENEQTTKENEKEQGGREPCRQNGKQVTRF